MALLHEFVFELTTPEPESPRILTPINDRLNRAWEKVGPATARGRRKVLKTKLTFAKADYKWFKEQFDLNEYAEYVLEIKRRCGGAGETPTLWHRGKILFSKASWDFARGTVDFELVQDDAWECFMSGMKKKVNLLDFGTSILVRNVHGELQQKECFYAPLPPTNEDDCITGGAAAGYWTKVFYEFRLTPFQITIRWQREKWTLGGSPPDNSWALITDPVDGPIYVRKVKVYGPTRYELGTSLHYQLVWKVLDFVDQEGIDNGRLFKTIFPLVIPESGCEFDHIRSTFFDVNPAGGPGTTAYDRALEKLKYLTFFQRSDILKWDAEENATRLEMTIEAFIEVVCKVFNCYWTIETADDETTFRIEHDSYFATPDGFDFTTGDFAKYVRAYERFELNSKEAVPSYERFLMTKYLDNSIFAPCEIFYGYPFTAAEPKEYAIPECTTDFQAMILADDDDDANLKGVFLMSVHLSDGHYYIDREYDEFNGALSWWELIRKYHKWGRPYSEGVFTSGSLSATVTFENVKRLKQTPEITVSMSCDQIENDFSPENLHKTVLGWGEVDTASEDTLTSSITLKLLY